MGHPCLGPQEGADVVLPGGCLVCMCDRKLPEPLVQPLSQWLFGSGSRELELGAFKMVNSSPTWFQTATSASFGNGHGPWRRKESVYRGVKGKTAPLPFLSCQPQEEGKSLAWALW